MDLRRASLFSHAGVRESNQEQGVFQTLPSEIQKEAT